MDVKVVWFGSKYIPDNCLDVEVVWFGSKYIPDNCLDVEVFWFGSQYLPDNCLDVEVVWFGLESVHVSLFHFDCFPWYPWILNTVKYYRKLEPRLKHFILSVILSTKKPF